MSITKHSTPVWSPSPYLHLWQTTIPRPPQSLYLSSFLLWHLRIIARQIAYSVDKLWTLLRGPFLGIPSRLANSLFRHPHDFVRPERNPWSNEIVCVPQEQIHFHLLNGIPFGCRLDFPLQGEASLITVNRPKTFPGPIFIIAIIALFLGSCTTGLTPTTSKAICSGWKPITYSSSKDRAVTVSQIKAHNLFGIRRGCWNAGGKNK